MITENSAMKGPMRADDIGELAQAEPNGNDGGCGHQACADKGIPVEVLVKVVPAPLSMIR